MRKNHNSWNAQMPLAPQIQQPTLPCQPTPLSPHRRRALPQILKKHLITRARALRKRWTTHQATRERLASPKQLLLVKTKQNLSQERQQGPKREVSRTWTREKGGLAVDIVSEGFMMQVELGRLCEGGTNQPIRYRFKTERSSNI